MLFFKPVKCATNSGHLICYSLCLNILSQVFLQFIVFYFLESLFFLETFYFLKFFINLFIYLFIYWLRWVFVAVRGLSLVVASKGYSSLWCTCFSLWWLLLLLSMDSRCAGLSSCGTWAQVAVAHGLNCSTTCTHVGSSGPGLEPISPDTAPPGKSLKSLFKCHLFR